MKQQFPILEFDPESKAKFEPGQLVKAGDVPEHCVLSFFQGEIQKLHQSKQAHIISKLKSEIGTHLIYKIAFEGKDLALLHPGVGAPLVSALFEEMIALGCRKFIVCGGCGVLRDLPVGKLLIPISAVRDEGTSYHYLPASREVHPSSSAVRGIKKILSRNDLEFEEVKTWTTDAFYRETAKKIALRKSEVCATVEMEAAALFAVAQFRQVEIGQILYAGDSLANSQWENRGWTKMTDLRTGLIWLAAEACLGI